LKTYNTQAISNRIDILRKMLENMTEAKGLNDPEVLHLSQKLDRYIVEVLNQQLKEYQNHSGKNTKCSTGSC
jgi:hypothetical protein